jgi:hypothetical protein
MKYILGFLCLFVAACDAPVVAVASTGASDTVAQCWDYNPCSFDFYSEKYGCTHEQMPDNTSCFDQSGIGVCDNGECVHSLCEDGSLDWLEGTCKIGQCVNGLYRIVPKIAGVPCVLARPVGDPPWIEGTCDDSGTCIASN